MFKLELATDNAAFDNHAGREVARILRKLAAEVEHGLFAGRDNTKLRDINGNTVGRAEWSE